MAEAMDGLPGEPTFLQALRVIAQREGAVGCWMEAWAECTDDVELEQDLRFVCAREVEHSVLFRKRVMCAPPRPQRLPPPHPHPHHLAATHFTLHPSHLPFLKAAPQGPARPTRAPQCPQTHLL